MNISRRDLFHLAAISGLSLTSSNVFAKLNELNPESFFEFKGVGNVTLLHICDLHAHLKPLYWREPSTLISAKELIGTPGFLCGKSFMQYYGIKPNTIRAYFDTYIGFEELAKKYGKMGGVSYIKSLVNRIKAERGSDKVLFMDSGDTWQGTAVGLFTQGKAIVDAQNALGIDIMVGHWEFTYGKDRVLELINKHLKAEFISQNIADEMWGDLIFKPYTIREVGGVKVAVIGNSFPYTPIANPKEFIEGWTFGIQPERLQKFVNEVRSKGADVVVLLSHNGFTLDQALAKMVKGIDVILSGHTHDPAPKPVIVDNTIIVIAGSHGKYLGRLDLEVKNKKITNFAFKLYPVASNFIKPDPEVEKLVEEVYKPYESQLSQVIGKTQTILYKRDTFYSTFDRVIMDALKEETDCEIVFNPGYRWGTTVLPGGNITVDDVYSMTAITYPDVYRFELTGQQIKNLLEDIADNVFNSNPLYQQGGDMSRTLGLDYEIKISAPTGQRISNIKVNGKDLDPNRSYVVASWGGNLYRAGKNAKKFRPVYDITIDYLKRVKVVNPPLKSNVKILDVGCGCPTSEGKCL
ncbi:thiosulfohydrolase SoxB [Sulfurihydrogenibium subterraneum]|uniref:thiosulfohydrolase SoxB n=1 Tax=Sulfurihydrogenibium subterraneum TaxID=171121 RepID=UPI00048AB9E5|nr:thiosulfohydrolase SoxB [Sulfurihydrogenibium subterraneum]